MLIALNSYNSSPQFFYTVENYFEIERPTKLYVSFILLLITYIFKIYLNNYLHIIYQLDIMQLNVI